MNREMQMKQHILDLLKQHMMGEEGKKFMPKEIDMTMVKKPPGFADGGEIYDTQGETGWGGKKNNTLGGYKTTHDEDPNRETDTDAWAHEDEKDIGGYKSSDMHSQSASSDHGESDMQAWPDRKEKDFGGDGGRGSEPKYDRIGTEQNFADGGYACEPKYDRIGSASDPYSVKQKRNMQGGNFEDMDLEHVEGGDNDYEDSMEGGPTNKKGKKMSLKEFLASKS